MYDVHRTKRLHAICCIQTNSACTKWKYCEVHGTRVVGCDQTRGGEKNFTGGKGGEGLEVVGGGGVNDCRPEQKGRAQHT